MDNFRERTLSVGKLVFRSLLLFLAVSGGSLSGRADDGIALTVERGSTPEEAVLWWTGNLPAYGVFRSQAPESVIGAGTQLGQTAATSWADTPPAAPIHYYNVSQPSCGDPANTACSSAHDLGTIFDFSGSGNIEVQLTNQVSIPGRSRWYRVMAADLPFDDWKLLAKVFNVSAGLDVDLYAYRRSDGNTCTSSPPVVPSLPESCNQDISGCGGNQENSNRCFLNSGTAAECVSWFEGCTGFLEDDQTVVWIEVRHVSGGCGTFDLKVRNNGNNDALTCATY
jgi:hypothetical protein